jgi:outer membrane protein assembly factor BamC
MLNKIELKSNTIKKLAVSTVIASLFIAGCSDKNYKRQIEGNEDYLNSPSLKSLIIPEGVSVPMESGDFYIMNNNAEGAVGKQLDIRPPTLAISTIPDSFLLYEHAKVTFNAPISYGVWNNIPNTLNKQNILISSSDNKTIKINNAIIIRQDEQQPVAASFTFTRQMLNETETITIVLDSLTRGAENLMSQPIEVQRYTVGLFNQIMDDVAPESLRTVVVKEKKDEDKESDSSNSLKEDLNDSMRHDR